MPSQNPTAFLRRVQRQRDVPFSRFQPDAGSFGRLKATAATKQKPPAPAPPVP